CMQGIEFPWTF
nr:immunoglobulin light chain junction region [Macaca mulatta]